MDDKQITARILCWIYSEESNLNPEAWPSDIQPCIQALVEAGFFDPITVTDLTSHLPDMQEWDLNEVIQ